MSTLQVANLHLEATGNNRIQYVTGNTIVFVTAGANNIVANSTVTIIGGSNNIFSNNDTTIIGSGNTFFANSTATIIRYGNSSSVDYRSVLDPGVVANSSYTLSISDSGKVLFLSNTAATTLTLPNNTSVPFPIGIRIDIMQYNTGQITYSNAVGTTLRSYLSRTKSAGQYTTATVYKKDTNEWVLLGDVIA